MRMISSSLEKTRACAARESGSELRRQGIKQITPDLRKGQLYIGIWNAIFNAHP